MNSLEAGIGPQELIGIWRRESILLRGVAGIPEVPRETADVLWFQAQSRYADLRLPRAPGAGPFSSAEAFGGRQTWLADRLCFHHELDRNGGFSDDEGALSWDGEILVETGEFVSAGVCCGYQERWVRTTPKNVSAEVWECRELTGALTGLAVRIAEQELILTLSGCEVRAELRLLDAGGFHVLARLGSAAGVAAEPSVDWTRVEGSSR